VAKLSLNRPRSLLWSELKEAAARTPKAAEAAEEDGTWGRVSRAQGTGDARTVGKLFGQAATKPSDLLVLL